ncbi:hypothetical protein IH979_03560 [Patescibacteria group bacterium]|nr:hypothetical protein [Patescibacteria group bacterium]
MFFNQSSGHQNLLGTDAATGFTPAPGTIPGQALISPDDDFAGKDIRALRGSLMFAPNEQTHYTLGGHWHQDRSEVPKYKTFAPDAFAFGGTSDDPFTVFGDEPDDQMDAKLAGGYSRVDHDLDWGTFVSNDGEARFPRYTTGNHRAGVDPCIGCLRQSGGVRSRILAAERVSGRVP